MYSTFFPFYIVNSFTLFLIFFFKLLALTHSLSIALSVSLCASVSFSIAHSINTNSTSMCFNFHCCIHVFHSLTLTANVVVVVERILMWCEKATNRKVTNNRINNKTLLYNKIQSRLFFRRKRKSTAQLHYNCVLKCQRNVRRRKTKQCML